jgi:hypothetical protein
MNNPSPYTLANLDFTGASGTPLTPITGIEGAVSVTIDVDFKFASPATPTGNVKVQTSFDGGTTWRDVARFDFAQASFVKHANLEFLLSKGVTVYAPLSAENVYDGVMGTQLRAVPSWTGSYAGSALAVRVNVR